MTEPSSWPETPDFERVPLADLAEAARALGDINTATKADRALRTRPLDLDGMTRKGMVRSVREIAADYVNFAVNPGNRYKLGLSWVDAITKGTAPGEVTVLLAPSSTGKTTVMINSMVANPTTPILFFSIEMPEIMVIARAYSISFDAEYKTLEDRLKSGDKALERELMADLAERLPYLGIVGRGGIGNHEMGQAIEEYAEGFSMRPQAVMIDYLDLIGGGSDSVENVKRKFNDLRELAKQHELAVIVAHQVVGKVLDERHGEPLKFNDGRYAGATEADHLIAMFREVNNPKIQEAPRDYDHARWTIHFQVLKTRSGEGEPKPREHGWNPRTLRVTDEYDVQARHLWEPPPPPAQRATAFLQGSFEE